MKSSSIIVIGTSAGGTSALKSLVAQLPQDFPAPIFVVQHMAADCSVEPLLYAIRRAGGLPCSEARQGQAFKPGHLYIASPDHHLLVTKGKLNLTKGARENRSRPGIDPLFRSAAVAYRNKVIGVLLTGYLDDGTAGLTAIQRCGGTCVVQDPDDAKYPDMPQNALNRLKINHTVPLAKMGALLQKLVQRKPSKIRPIPADVAIEAQIASRVLSDLPSVAALGAQVPFNCPNCGGVLWEISKGHALRFRCHTGHSYTASVLLAEQTSKIEETLWVALRMFEERRNLLITMSKERGSTASSASRAKESEVHIDRIRTMLKSGVHATTIAVDKRHSVRRATRSVEGAPSPLSPRKARVP